MAESSSKMNELELQDDHDLIVPRLLLLYAVREAFPSKLPIAVKKNGGDWAAFCVGYVKALEAMRNQVVMAVISASASFDVEVEERGIYPLPHMVSKILGQPGPGGAGKSSHVDVLPFWRSLGDDDDSSSAYLSVDTISTAFNMDTIAIFSHAFDEHVLAFLQSEPLYSTTLLEALLGALPHPGQSWMKFVEATFLDDDEQLAVVGVIRMKGESDGSSTYLSILQSQPRYRRLLTFGLLMLHQLIPEVAHAVPRDAPPLQITRIASTFNMGTDEFMSSSWAAAPSATPPAKTKKAIYRIFYATDRSSIPAEPEAASHHYEHSPRWASLEKLKFGIAEVEIKVPVGEPESPITSTADISITHYIRMNNEHFFEAINSQLDEASNDYVQSTDIIIFIHGFNTNFDDSIIRGAQLKRDLKIDGVFVVYSWSSSESLNLVGEYFKDGEAVQATIPYLASLIKECMGKVKGGRLHLLAHSMGNRALMGALAELYKESAEWIERGMPLRTVIFAAADEVLPHLEEILEEGNKVGNKVEEERRHRFSVYCADDDMALWAAQTIMKGAQYGGKPRVGLTSTHFQEGATTLKEPPETGYLDAMDATGAAKKVWWPFPGGLNHGYFASVLVVVDDIEQLMCTLGKQRAINRLAPHPGGLFQVNQGQGNHFYTFFPNSWNI